MISGIYTGFLLLSFLGVVIWAWSKKNKASFEEMSRMALKDDDQLNNYTDEQTEEKSHE